MARRARSVRSTPARATVRPARRATAASTAVAPRPPSVVRSSTPTVRAAAATVPVPVAPPSVDYSPEGILAANPYDSASTTERVGYSRAEYARLMGARATQRSNLASSMGFRFTDDAANGRGFTLDFESNPYSQAALLKRQWLGQKQATIGQAASSGLIYDGSTQQAMMNDDFNEGRDYTQLTENFGTGLGDIESTTQTSLGEIIKGILDARATDAENRAKETAPVAAAPAPTKPVASGHGWTAAKPWSPANPIPPKYQTAADKKKYNAWLKKQANQQGASLRAAYPRGF